MSLPVFSIDEWPTPEHYEAMWSSIDAEMAREGIDPTAALEQASSNVEAWRAAPSPDLEAL